MRSGPTTSALLLTLAVALGATGCTDDDGTLEAGESARVLDAPELAASSENPTLTVRLPTGTLRVGWTVDPDVTGSLTDDHGNAFEVADDAELVGVAWSLDTASRGGAGVAGAATSGTAPHELVLLGGDLRVVLADEEERRLEGTAVVAAPDADGLAVEVTFDGDTQVVGPDPDDRDVSGAAAALYETAPSASADLGCRSGGEKVFCRADATWLPWTAEQGWAPDGQLWPVVRVEARLPGATPESPVRVTLDGAEPTGEGQDLGATDGVNRLVVFPAVDPVPAQLRLELDGPDGTVGAVRGQAELTPAATAG